ncbi:DoxX family protein [Vibrio sp. CDRSL-10 TSBA]
MNALLKKLMSTTAGFAPLALRIPIGIIYMAHGSQKLFGWFGGYGLEGTGQWMASIGIEPGVLMAFLAGSGEFLWWSVAADRSADPPCSVCYCLCDDCCYPERSHW